MGLRTSLVGITSLSLLTACNSAKPSGPAPTAAVSSAPSEQASAAPQKETPAKRAQLAVTQGSAVALTLDGKHVIVADEDHEVLYVTPPSFEDLSSLRVVTLPGPPGQIVVLDGVVLVTVRTVPTDDSRAARDAIRGAIPTSAGAHAFTPEPGAPKTTRAKPVSSTTKPPPTNKEAPRPKASSSQAPSLDPSVVRKSKGGLLVAFALDADKGLTEIGRVELAPDAWGLAVDPTGTRAVVSSAWAAEVAVLDVGDPHAMRVVAKLPTAREPRGIVVTPDGKTAYISHLVGSALTRIDDLGGAPHGAVVPLRPAPERGPAGHETAASLGYSLTLAPDGKTLFAPRHAIGAEGNGTWWGAPTVDVMDVASGKSLQPVREVGSPASNSHPALVMPPPEWGAIEGQAPKPLDSLVQPRAVVYRKHGDALLVLSEGYDDVAILDALAPSPAMAVVGTIQLGSGYATFGDYPTHGGAPSGIVLTADESSAYVYCRTTFELARIDFADDGSSSKSVSWLHLADDGLAEAPSRGRRLFASARSEKLSDGIACAACHPEGRDDGYTWREGKLEVNGGANGRFVGLRENVKREFFVGQTTSDSDRVPLFPRQTPMIAGRVRSPGPFAWHGEDKDMLARLIAGSKLHRGAWEFGMTGDAGPEITVVDYLMEYARAGLMPPPTLARDLTEQEKHGKEIFENASTRCAECHKPEREMTDRSIVDLNPLPTLPGFDAEDDHRFKTPSLWFVGGTAPYFHDGSAATLEDLVKNNGARMGNTSTLSPDDREALVAYLRTL